MGDFNFANINWEQKTANHEGKKLLDFINDVELTRGDTIMNLVLTSDGELLDGLDGEVLEISSAIVVKFSWIQYKHFPP